MIFKGKRILVTGGTGSMGRTFVHRVLSGALGTPKKVVVFSRDEAKQHDMRMAYLHRTVTTDEVIFNNFRNVLEFRIGDVRDYGDVCSALKDADIVVNAAALKQVPTCEYFPAQAILTNCIGAHNIVRAIEEEHAGPEIDRRIELTGEVVIESRDQEMLHARVVFGALNRFGMATARRERITYDHVCTIITPDSRSCGRSRHHVRD